MKRLVIDTANLFFRVASAHSKYQSSNGDDKAALALHSCLVTMNKWFRQVNPDQILVTFEGSKNWRKDYTASPQCLSKVGYKANRVRDPAMDHLFQVISDFEKLAREHTSIICLSNERLEGDDLIAGAAQKFSAMGDEVVILSGDKDFTSLLKYQGVQLLNPDKGILREHDDPLFFIFEKCVRGDAGDNVRSAYPKVRKTRIEKAFKDDYERTLFMNETWKFVDPETKEETEYRVGDLFNENQMLMDLEAQPADIRELMSNTIDTALQNHGKFSMFHFSKFLGQHELTKIAESSEKFVRMFSCKPIVNTDQPTQRGVLQF